MGEVYTGAKKASIQLEHCRKVLRDLSNNLYICYGCLNGGFASARTCTKESVIDYLITTIDGFLLINNFDVHGYSPLFSYVHCAIAFVIENATSY